MKILYITNGVCGSGGLERVLSIKASLLADKKAYEIHILTLNQKNNSLFYDFSENIVFHNIKTRGSFLKVYDYVKGITKVVNGIEPDVISVCDDGLKGLFVPLYFKKRIPIVYERHTVKQVYQKTNPKSLLSKLKFRMQGYAADLGSQLFDKFIVLTKENTKEWNKVNAQIIPNPISFYPETPAALDKKRVISVGSMSHVKGFDLLLRAWKLVVERFPDWKLDIYGKTILKQELLILADELGISDNVSLNEPVANIEDKYMDASIYALSSRFEGFGMVLIEAMACGLPCVSFDCPLGPKDIISDGVDGYLVSPLNVSELADKLLLLIKDNHKRKELGAHARNNVNRYLPDVIVQEWDDLFKALIKN
ncbi:MAG: glycosyltransferase family 4 protein [Carboxylicivirga sp.]|jgi:glycosyltransferase involved in cell wall biosynthesis|nr:glycosyltransferase family 4 protein [Carboxylicivirga sp.]